MSEKVERAVEWIEELAANEFNQRTCRLGSVDEGFCCLGVAQYLHRDYCWSDEGPDYSDNSYLDFYGKLGLRGGAQHELGRMNDLRGLSFPEIAQRMLSNPYEFFTDSVAEGIEDYFFNGGAA